MDEDHHGARRERASGLRHAVVAPGGVEHRLVRHAGGLLIEERHAVGVADEAGELIVVLVRLALRQRNRLVFFGLLLLFALVALLLLLLFLPPPPAGPAR